jgi:transcription initiation factor TFIIB
VHEQQTWSCHGHRRIAFGAGVCTRCFMSNPTPNAPLRYGGLAHDDMFRVNCPECRNSVPNLMHDPTQGELLCRDCGLVLSQVIDERSEWRTFSSTESADPSRVGAPVDLNANEQMSTMISSRPGSRDLQRIHAQVTQTPQDRTMQSGYKTIAIFADRLDIPKAICDTAKELYRKVEESRIVRGRTGHGVVAACIYIACHQHAVPRTYKEIEAVSRVSKTDMGRIVRQISEPTNSRRCVSFDSCIPRFCSQINASELERGAVLIARKIQEQSLGAGKNPNSIQATCIFMMSLIRPKSKKTLRDISIVSGVSEATIRGTYRDLYKLLSTIVPPEVATPEVVQALPVFFDRADQ